MNSLLQALYMTPQFRQLIYGWRYDQDKNPEKKDCIIYQLQKLFASMQLIQEKMEDDESVPDFKTPFANTSDLIASFQWDYKEAMQQHDI